MKALPVLALGLFVGLAGCNGDKYTGKIENADDLGACYAKALKAEIAYRTELNLRIPDLDLQVAEDPEALEKWSRAAADLQISLIGLWKANRKTINQMVQEVERPIGLRDGAEFAAACDVAYITQEKVVWPDL